MGSVTFPFTLTAGQPENVNQLNSNLAALQTVINGQVDATNLAANAVTTVKITDANVTTAKLADLAVTAAKIEAQQAWQSIALTGFSGNLSYYKDSLGFVHFRGDALITTGSIGNATAMCTMPVGYRPVSDQWFLMALTDAQATYAIVLTAAGVLSNGPTATPSGARPLTFGLCHYRAQ